MSYFLLATVLVIALTLKSPSVKGYIGEVLVNIQLKKLDPANYILLRDVLLTKNNGQTTQVDHIIVSIFGIFVIETKNYQGLIFGSEKSQYWTQVIYKKKLSFIIQLNKIKDM
ncbi:NERD domain-containing protein [Fictibacillus nanhaiensis]|uniref:nuclease-related domain-containing protein n=1 Tax=Fictibacillus nanhaiensis TaxID=742169 RepID=UPI00203A5392|nr:nuclease-related domain-containing protein [Fictibacillus nanhaiensis]MCM3733151.1 NERD domain-containing protein [Fictibacillus nanhaiensis]